MRYVSRLIEAVTDGHCVPQPDASGNYVLTLDGEVAVTLREADDGEHCFLASSPGWVALPQGASAGSPCWQQDTPDAEVPGMFERLCVDPSTGLMSLMHVWPRATVTSVALREILDRHLRLHRHWQGLLQAPEAPPIDGRD